MDPAVKAAIPAIPEDAWTPVRYPRAIWDGQLRAWVPDAEIPGIAYTAFASKKGQATTARLIARRARDQNRTASSGQGELFPAWRYHPAFTGSPFTLTQAGEQHRDHAVAEQVSADRTDGPMAHLPSGHFTANPAWLTLTAMPGNPAPAAGCLAPAAHARARGATTRRDLIDVAARTARRGRGRLVPHLPGCWHRQAEWHHLFQAARGPPRARAARPAQTRSPRPHGPAPPGITPPAIPRPVPGQPAEPGKRPDTHARRNHKITFALPDARETISRPCAVD